MNKFLPRAVFPLKIAGAADAQGDACISAVKQTGVSGTVDTVQAGSGATQSILSMMGRSGSGSHAKVIRAVTVNNSTINHIAEGNSAVVVHNGE